MLWEKYRITPNDYAVMLRHQGGSCAVCDGPPNGRGAINGRFFVDHDHQTGQVRGLLCSFCNSALGYLEDSPVRMQRAIHYLSAGPIEIDFERAAERERS